MFNDVSLLILISYYPITFIFCFSKLVPDFIFLNGVDDYVIDQVQHEVIICLKVEKNKKTF